MSTTPVPKKTGDLKMQQEFDHPVTPATPTLGFYSPCGQPEAMKNNCLYRNVEEMTTKRKKLPTTGEPRDATVALPLPEG